jgi:hypothetical protein
MSSLVVLHVQISCYVPRKAFNNLYNILIKLNVLTFNRSTL